MAAGGYRLFAVLAILLLPVTAIAQVIPPSAAPGRERERFVDPPIQAPNKAEARSWDLGQKACAISRLMLVATKGQPMASAGRPSPIASKILNVSADRLRPTSRSTSARVIVGRSPA